MILHISEYSNVQLRSYFSACHSNLALRSIFSYLYIYLCGSFSCIFLFVLSGCQNVFDYDDRYQMAHVFWICPLINFVKTTLNLIHSLPWLVEEGSYPGLKIETVGSQPLYSLQISIVCVRCMCPLYASMVEMCHYDTFSFTHFFYSVLYFSAFLFIYVWTSIN